MRAPQARRRVLLSRPDGVTFAALLHALRRGDRRALARAITLVESSRPDLRGEAESVIEALLPETGKAVRIGISGPPGAGKSTFIERFGLAGIGLGRRIAVLAVDPASKRGGGAILGDKTRMAELARAPEAFIRAALEHSRAWSHRRTEQARAALWSEIGDTLLDHFRTSPVIAEHLATIEEQVTTGTRTPSAAARQLLAAFLGGGSQITATQPF